MAYHESVRSTVLPRWYKKNPMIDTAILTQTFVGIVRDSRDPQAMGRLLVWIPELTGDSDKPENWIICSYCSPFAGSSFINNSFLNDTKGAGGGSNAIEDITNRARRQGRQPETGRQSYGMWFVPPDVGNEVLITFINGDVNFGVWFGCLIQQDMNHMIPGIAENAIDGTGQRGPVIEADLRNDDVASTNDEPSRNEYQPLKDGLQLQQGLDQDRLRGQTSASARRESPSETFGILTPNGNQFVLDDKFDEQLIRLRTKSGAQLLINETAGFIYAISRDGNTWIELSNEGNVDVYARFNISFHAEKGNINLKAGQDVNIQSTRDVSIRSDKNMKFAIFGDADIKGLGNIKIQVDGAMHQKSGGIMRQTSGDTFHIIAGGDYREQAPNIFMNSGGAEEAVNALLPNTYIPSGASIPPENNGTWKTGDPYDEGTNTIPRVPQHEPFANHDAIQNDDVFVPGPTQFFNNDSRVKPSNTPVNLSTSDNNISPPESSSNEETPPILPNTTPLPSNSVCGLTREETQILMDSIGYRESSSRTNIENTLGFVGKYQFGTAALEDIGLIKKGTFNAARGAGLDPQDALNNSNNWTISGGKETFLNNPELQEESMIRLMNRNCVTMTNNGTITNNTTKQEIGGLIAAAHLGGPGGAQALLDGNARTDVYGGSTTEYFQLGARAIRESEKQSTTT